MDATNEDIQRKRYSIDTELNRKLERFNKLLFHYDTVLLKLKNDFTELTTELIPSDT